GAPSRCDRTPNTNNPQPNPRTTDGLTRNARSLIPITFPTSRVPASSSTTPITATAIPGHDTIARHAGTLSTRTDTAVSAGTTVDAYSTCCMLTRLLSADSQAMPSANTNAITPTNHPSGIHRAERAHNVSPSTALNASSPITPARPRMDSHSKPVSVRFGRTNSASPPAGTNSRPVSACSVHSPITSGADSFGADTATRPDDLPAA